MLELGAGHGRNSIFFASNGIEKIDALDYSVVAIQLLEKTAKEKGLSTTIYPHLFNVKNPFPFQNDYYDAVYSHMLLNMRT